VRYESPFLFAAVFPAGAVSFSLDSLLIGKGEEATMKTMTGVWIDHGGAVIFN
jgi:hypothetical protein